MRGKYQRDSIDHHCLRCVSYLLGSLPFGVWIGLAWKGVDIRTLGSKNIGATNVLRVLGPAPAAVVFLLDTLKGVLGIVLFGRCFGHLPIAFRILIGFARFSAIPSPRSCVSKAAKAWRPRWARCWR